MEIAQVAAIGVISVILALAIRRQNAEYALLISIAASLIIFFMLMPLLGQAVGILKNIADLIDTNTQYVGVILKIIAIAYIAEFGAQICVDAGEAAVASKIELAGKILIIVTSTPVLFGLVNLITGIMP
ncbi:MAG: stage III sporulation protein AD [Clostridiales bacterium]|jgi:stage III sporulation protein AD|nr:stage III sporulation protein AD [Clostridiales bacterium]